MILLRNLWFRLVLSLCVTGVYVGCGNPATPPARSPLPIKSSDVQELQQAIEEISQGATAPPPVINLATPPGWSKSETRPLPTDDHGFTVAFEHESGLSVTLYQFTRGMTSIPDDVTSAPVQEEMNRAKGGIEQSVELGYYQSAELYTADTVVLGESGRKALWAQYNLTIEDRKVASDIYVWSCANTFFKLRCTSRSEDVISNHEVLVPLLTSLGSPATSTEWPPTKP